MLLPQQLQLHTNMTCTGTCCLKFLCCCVAALVMACSCDPAAAECISARLHALGSCSTGVPDLAEGNVEGKSQGNA